MTIPESPPGEAQTTQADSEVGGCAPTPPPDLCPTCRRLPSERFGRSAYAGSPAEKHGLSTFGRPLVRCSDPVHDFADAAVRACASLGPDPEAAVRAMKAALFGPWTTQGPSSDDYEYSLVPTHLIRAARGIVPEGGSPRIIAYLNMKTCLTHGSVDGQHMLCGLPRGAMVTGVKRQEFEPGRECSCAQCSHEARGLLAARAALSSRGR